jgi:hypothetical protein
MFLMIIFNINDFTNTTTHQFIIKQFDVFNFLGFIMDLHSENFFIIIPGFFSFWFLNRFFSFGSLTLL